MSDFENDLRRSRIDLARRSWSGRADESAGDQVRDEEIEIKTSVSVEMGEGGRVELIHEMRRKGKRRQWEERRD